jgi:hypothetical protein
LVGDFFILFEIFRREEGFAPETTLYIHTFRVCLCVFVFTYKYTHNTHTTHTHTRHTHTHTQTHTQTDRQHTQAHTHIHTQNILSIYICPRNSSKNANTYADCTKLVERGRHEGQGWGEGQEWGQRGEAKKRQGNGQKRGGQGEDKRETKTQAGTAIWW